MKMAIENGIQALEKFFPSEVVQLEFEADFGLTVWDHVIETQEVEVGPRRMLVADNVLRIYVFEVRRYTNAFAKREISLEKLMQKLAQIKNRIDYIEESIEKSIERSNTEQFHKAALLLLLRKKIDTVYRSIGGHNKIRTKMI